MYIDVGGNICIAIRTIVAVFDLDSITASAKNKTGDFLHLAAENAHLITVEAESLPQSLILTTQTAYLSPYSSKKIRERLLRWRY